MRLRMCRRQGGCFGELEPVIFKIQRLDGAVVVHLDAARIVVNLQHLNAPVPLAFDQNVGFLLRFFMGSLARLFGQQERLLSPQNVRDARQRDFGHIHLRRRRFVGRRGRFEGEHIPPHDAFVRVLSGAGGVGVGAAAREECAQPAEDQCFSSTSHGSKYINHPEKHHSEYLVAFEPLDTVVQRRSRRELKIQGEEWCPG